MSWNPSLEPGCPDAVGADAIETLIVPRARDLGDFEVRRALPAPKRQIWSDRSSSSTRRALRNS
jgi:hypothetical protein